MEAVRNSHFNSDRECSSPTPHAMLFPRRIRLTIAHIIYGKEISDPDWHEFQLRMAFYIRA